MSKENGWFSMADARVSATVRIASGYVSTNLIEEMVEFNLPEEFLKVTPMQNVNVPLKSLLHLIGTESAPLSWDRESAIKQIAAMLARASYGREVSIDLPPEVHDEIGRYMVFDADYILRLVADDVESVSPNRAARLRKLASDHYSVDEDEDWEPSDEEHASIVAALETFPG